MNESLTVRSSHDKAMRYAQEAWLARQQGRDDEARELSRQALPLELEAIAILERDGANDPRLEPTRSILYCSAASLALGAGDVDMCRTLAQSGLAGMPDNRTRADLEELAAIT